MKTELKIYLGITIILLTDLILYLSVGISFTGNLIDRILFWVWFIGTFYVIFKFIKRRWAKIYGIILGILTLASLMPMGIPFLTITAFAIDKEDSIKIDDEIRIVETAKSVIARPQISVIKNYWIFEKEIGQTEFDFEVNDKYYRINDASSINRLSEVNDKKIRLEFEFETGKIIRELE